MLRFTDRLLRVEAMEGFRTGPAALALGLATRLPGLPRELARRMSCLTRVPWRTGAPPLPVASDRAAA
ncbi:hypothetical protein ACTWPT_25705 [Nonomuraea sp. 3N208]|uniref:hypothetical protein n=1 Tax=Nonomuraea sp. 3N208 TaxID=3457421 RepID=UPI003FCFA010